MLRLFRFSPATHAKGVKLHVGCGDLRLPGWTNVDVRPGPAVDLVEDVFTLPSYEEGSVDVIYACHVLEHAGLPFSSRTTSYRTALARWFHLLKPGGMLFVSVPDLYQVFEGLRRFDGHKNQQAFLRALFGGQEYPENTHYCGFTRALLTDELAAAGFESVREFSSFAEDTSRFRMFGLSISLNLVAFKAKAKS